jgi:hypothetical protein
MKIINVSCRKNFESDTKFSKTLRYENWCDSILNNNSNVLVLVHGYCAVYDKVTKAYADVAINCSEFIPNHYTHVVNFYWPSSWSKTIGFLAAKTRVQEASEFLTELINGIGLNPVSKNRIVVQGHSLGCDVINRAFMKNDKSIRSYVDSVVYSAPAMTNLEFYKTLPSPNEHSRYQLRKLNIAYSNNDKTLKYAFRLIPPSHWTSSAVGYKPSKEIMDVFTKYKNVYDFSSLVHSHSEYRKVKEYYTEVLVK